MTDLCLFTPTHQRVKEVYRSLTWRHENEQGPGEVI